MLAWTKRILRPAARWLRGPAGRLASQVCLTVGLVAGMAAVAVYAVPLAGPSWAYGDPAEAAAGEPSREAEPLALPPGVDAVPGLPDPAVEEDEDDLDGGDLAPAQALRNWAAPVAAATDVPVRALQAYGLAELVLGAEKPACNLAWTTLAGIGRIESNHGTTGGTEILPDGVTADPIRGPALDGTDDNKNISDTDGGRLDGDAEYDRAMGPMQFIPTTWESWGVDGNQDGIADMDNIDDAAVSAGYYLCADGRDLSDSGDWYDAVFAYNHLDVYVHDVYDAADRYGTLSRDA